MTNEDNIRGMTDKQLAGFLANVVDCYHCPIFFECTKGISCAEKLLAWLKQEHDENEHG